MTMRRRWIILLAAGLGCLALLALDRAMPPDLARARALGGATHLPVAGFTT